MSKVETHHVDWPACWGVVELGGSVEEGLPVEEDGGVFALVTDEIFTDNYDTDTSGSKILLSTSIYNSIFLPIDGSGTDV